MYAILLLMGLSGFDRVYVAPEPSGDASLTIENPYGARAVVSVDGVAIGELLPRATGTVEKVRLGEYKIAFKLPNGRVRTLKINAE
jgi:hypothetical protein